MVCGAVNDAFKITRALLFGEAKKKNAMLSILLFVEDMILVICIGCGVVALNFYLNRGQFRAYSVLALAVGFAVYYFTVGKLVGVISVYIVRLIRAVVRIIYSVVSYPIKLIFRCVKKIFLYFVKKIKLAIEKIRVMRYNKREAALLAEKEIKEDERNEI
jgi:hypothetical protein